MLQTACLKNIGSISRIPKMGVFCAPESRKYATTAQNVVKQQDTTNLSDSILHGRGHKFIRVVAATVVERIPIVLPEPPLFEKEYLAFKEKRNFLLEKERSAVAEKRLQEELKLRAKKESKKDKSGGGSQGKKEKQTAEEAVSQVQSSTGLYSLITDADKKNDLKSLYRKLNNRLYLIVKKPRKEHAWQFPQGGYIKQIDGFHLRKTAERELQEELGSKLQVWFVGNAPMGHLIYPTIVTPNSPFAKDIPQDIKSITTKVFFYKARYLRGDIKLDKKELEDHLWVTKDELKQYFSPEYYNTVSQFLLD